MKPGLMRGDIQSGPVGAEDVCTVLGAGGVNTVTPDMRDRDTDHLLVTVGSLCLKCVAF